jgi:hypothetical protein
MRSRDHNRLAVVAGQYGAVKALTTRGAYVVSIDGQGAPVGVIVDRR